MKQPRNNKLQIVRIARLAGPSGIIIQQDRRFGNTFGNGFENEIL